jgi:hypothetical protein
MLKPVGKSLRRNRVCLFSKHLPQGFCKLLNETVNSQWRNLQTPSDQANITRNKTESFGSVVKVM